MPSVVSIRDAKNRLTELARKVEKGERIVVTRNGRPILDLVPHEARSGLDLAGLAAFKAGLGLREIVGPIPAGFDDALPEDVLVATEPTGA